MLDLIKQLVELIIFPELAELIRRGSWLKQVIEVAWFPLFMFGSVALFDD